MRPEAIVFDLDGTLVDSRQDLAGSVQAAFEAAGLPRPAYDDVVASVGHGAHALLEVLLDRAGIVAPDAALIESIVERFRAHYLEHLLDHTALFPGMEAVLDTLGGRARLAVLTNKPGEMARRIVEGLGLGGRFAWVLGPDDVDALKPDPKGLRWVLARLEVAPERATYVGDMPIDVEVARAAGTRAVGVAWGLAPAGEIEAAGPDALARTVAALPGLV